jgi:cobalt-zinc-cadmium efflux system membrane fusion protein
LPALLRLKPKERQWTIRLKSDPKAPPMHGTFDAPGYVLDLNQHTALVMGLVDNPEGTLRAGQFVTATVELPPPQDVVVIPSNALVEDGQDSIVFVQENPDLPEYTMRPVVVEQRRNNTILVRSLKKTDLQPHDLLVVQSVVELKAALEDLKSSSQNEKP